MQAEARITSGAILMKVQTNVKAGGGLLDIGDICVVVKGDDNCHDGNGGHSGGGGK
jgi:hypothetical protein